MKNLVILSVLALFGSSHHQAWAKTNVELSSGFGSGFANYAKMNQSTSLDLRIRPLDFQVTEFISLSPTVGAQAMLFSLSSKGRTTKDLHNWESQGLALGGQMSVGKDTNYIDFNVDYGISRANFRWNRSTTSSSDITRASGVSGSFGRIEAMYRYQHSSRVAFAVGLYQSWLRYDLSETPLKISSQNFSDNQLSLSETVLAARSTGIPDEPSFNMQGIKLSLSLSL